MSITLRVLLLMGSVLTAILILRKIRKNRVRQEDALFWICFATVLALLGIFPEISFSAAKVLGIQSPANFVFLAIIAMLLEKILSLSVQLSFLENRIEIMAAELAIRCGNIEGSLRESSETGAKHGNV